MGEVIKFKPKVYKMKITLYTRPKCTLCEKTKDMLRAKKLHFFEYNIDLNGLKEEIKTKYPSLKELPVVLIDDHVIGGRDELDKLLDNERMEK